MQKSSRRLPLQGLAHRQVSLHFQPVSFFSDVANPTKTMMKVEPAKPLIVWPFGINQHHFVVEISQCSKIETYLYSHHFWVKLNYRKQMAPLLMFPKTEPNPASKNLSNSLQKSQRVELIPFRILYCKGECWQSLSWRVDFYHTVSNFQIKSTNTYLAWINQPRCLFGNSFHRSFDTQNLEKL